MQENIEGKSHPEELKPSLPGDKIFRRRRHRLPTLKKALGVLGLFSIGYGNLGSSIYYALGVTALYALGATPVVFLLAGILFIATAYTYAEGTAAIPEAGGSSSFARRGFNEFVSFFAAWALLLDYIVTIAISIYTAVGYLAYFQFFSFLQDHTYHVIASVGMLLFLMVLNIKGVQESSKVNVIFAIFDLISQTAIVIIGSIFLLNIKTIISQIHWGVVPEWKPFVFSFSIAMVAFTGIESISNMAEEAKNPEKNIPRAVSLCIVAVLLIFLTISSIALSVMPVLYEVEGYIYQNHAKPGSYVYVKEPSETQGVAAANLKVRVDEGKAVVTDKNGRFFINGVQYGKHAVKVAENEEYKELLTFDNTRKNGEVKGDWYTELDTKWINNPLVGIAHHIPKGGKFIAFLIATLAFIILLIATNAGLLGISRLSFSMGTYNQIPPILGRVHKRYRTPYVAIIFFTILAIIIIIPADITKLADAYSFGALLSYTIAHISIIALRIREPELKRPFKLKGNIKIPFNWKFGRYDLKGKEIPLSALIGGIGTFTVWVIVAVTHHYGPLIGVPFIAFGIIMYVVYRKMRGLSLTETVHTKVKRPVHHL